jgi:hypothetical protein
VPELQPGPERRAVGVEGCRCPVCEAQRQRFPLPAEQLADDAQQRSRGQLRRLSRGRRLAELEPQPHRGQVPVFVEAHPQRLVVAVFVPAQQSEGAAQVGLLAQHDAQRAERRQPAQAGQSQAEVIESRLVRRPLQHPRDRRCGHPLVGNGQVGHGDTGVGQDARRIEPDGPGQAEVAVERCSANAGTHRGPPIT